MKKQEEKNFKQKIEEKGGIIRDNNHAITLIALVITVIVLLILARNFYFNVKSEITIFCRKQQQQKLKLKNHK